MRTLRTAFSWLGLPALIAFLVPAVLVVSASWYLRLRVQEQLAQQIDATLDLSINLEKTLIDSALGRALQVAVTAAATPQVQQALARGTGPADGPAPGNMRSLLTELAGDPTGADILVVAGPDGTVRGRKNSDAVGDRISYGGIVERVLELQAPLASPIIIPAREVAAEGAASLARWQVPVVATPGATGHALVGSVLHDVLALVGAAPVVSADGQLLGAVLTADVLNNDFRIVDEVTQRSPAGVPLTATIALDGIRVTTNVQVQGGGRAVGTLYSDPVMARLRAGDDYRGKALVGGWQWQRTIYIPLRDFRGRIVAGPFVGIPESHFEQLESSVGHSTWLVTGVAFAGPVLALFVAWQLAKSRLLEGLDGRSGISDLSDVVRLVERSETGLRQAAEAARSLREITEAMDGQVTQATTLIRGTGDLARECVGQVEGLAACVRDIPSPMGELDVLLGQVTAGAETGLRAVEHVRSVAEELASDLRACREEVARVAGVSRGAFATTQELRQALLRALAAYEVIRSGVAQLMASAAPTPGGTGALLVEVERGGSILEEADGLLRDLATGVDRALSGFWEVAGVISESCARVTAIAHQMEDVTAALEATAGRAESVGGAAERLRGQLDASVRASEAVAQATGRLHDQAERLEEVSRQLQALAMRLNRVSESLGGLTPNPGGSPAWRPPPGS